MLFMGRRTEEWESDKRSILNHHAFRFANTAAHSTPEAPRASLRAVAVTAHKGYTPPIPHVH